MENPNSIRSCIKDPPVGEGLVGAGRDPRQDQMCPEITDCLGLPLLILQKVAQSLTLWLCNLPATTAQKVISPWPLSSRAKILSSWKYPTHPNTPAHRLHWADPGSLQGSWQMAPCGLIRKSDEKIRPPLPFARNWDCLDFNHSHSEEPT